MINERKKHISSHENEENEIENCFKKTEQDILAHRIIHAYYNLQKTSKMITGLQKSNAQKRQFKEKQKLLNNKLNNQILKFIDNEGNYNGRY